MSPSFRVLERSLVNTYRSVLVLARSSLRSLKAAASIFGAQVSPNKTLDQALINFLIALCVIGTLQTRSLQGYAILLAGIWRWSVGGGASVSGVVRRSRMGRGGAAWDFQNTLDKHIVGQNINELRSCVVCCDALFLRLDSFIDASSVLCLCRSLTVSCRGGVCVCRV